MKLYCLAVIGFLFFFATLTAQIRVSTTAFNNSQAVKLIVSPRSMSVSWPAGNQQQGKMVLSLVEGEPLFSSIQLGGATAAQEIVKNADPAFILTVGRRDLVSQNGWNIFFDKVPLKPHASYRVQLKKTWGRIKTDGSRTIISIGNLSAPGFAGYLEITLYNNSPLFNVAAVVATRMDSTAIVYDAGIISRQQNWKNISWSDVYGNLQQVPCTITDTSVNDPVKYRTIIGSNQRGSMAVFPAPHQYFYPLDEAFNLRFTWHGSHYRQLVDDYGIGIRQDLYGDHRYVPWFNAPPKTKQRLHFFCYLSTNQPRALLEQVKAFTHADSYVRLPGYKTMASHFHNEHIMQTVLAGKLVPDTPSFVKVFAAAGIDIVHLAEFHYTAHPKGPDSLRLHELKALFHECERLSSSTFLLLPGEEPNEFFGGHWLAFFPKPVYWVMSRAGGIPWVQEQPGFGNVYHIADSADMLQLLTTEKGLAWTAHARTKGSTGFPDAYRQQPFFLSEHFLGAAWKAMPADLSQPRLGKRTLDLLDDMNNWGLKKKLLSEADLFSIEPENEMYAHLNVNYLQLDTLPAYRDGWQPVLDVLQKGQFFSSTGEVLLPQVTINGKHPGETLGLLPSGQATISFRVQWTFPLQFAEIISGDGQQVYRHRINLTHTAAFGDQVFNNKIDLSGRKWVRLEVWDAAVNGAFTQTIWLQ